MQPMSHLPRQDPLAEDKNQSLGTEGMSSTEFTLGMLFISQTTVGVLGNFSLLYHHITLYFTGCRLRSTDSILTHLTVANFLVILSKGIPQTLAALGWKDFLNDFGCKFIFYLHRVGRGVTMGSTCLLSVFQAITISPRNSRWAKLKLKAPKYISPSNILFWVLHMLVNILVLFSLTGNRDKKSSKKRGDSGYCSFVFNDITTCLLHVALFSFPDVVCLGLMTWASGSMVFILYRHKQQVQHIHRNNISARSSPESRATQSILVLVSTFVSFYTVSYILSICLILFYPSWWMVNTATLTSACFPTISPFVLLSHDSRVSKNCHVCTEKKTQFCHLIKNI
ncbi:vomeronasal type-1 receptor 4-like [Orycteropus afer afer]|uniref:Vomeronasal type-1 receptor n=1 Tax=Orycteropus afer afer TaxID=1230840 RepID=A0A8B7B8R2_ORYAF|nr:vomeronasal type-1 receptor 4-like [Orycteropus afer afer]